MTTLEQELMEKISRLDEDKQRRILEFVETIENGMPAERTYTAQELMRLPFEERNRIAKAALERSLDDDVELFEAFGEADFNDE
jgi:hypothetical protein